MTDISGTIRTRALASASVTNLVGTRMYSDTLPQTATMPAITYFVVDTIPNECLGGTIANLSQARIQIDCFDDTRAGANKLADTVRLALEMNNHVTTDSQYILAITLDSGEQHTFDRPLEGSDKRRYIASQDFRVSYRQTTS